MAHGYRMFVLTSAGIIVGSILCMGFAVMWFLGSAEGTAKAIAEKRLEIKNRSRQLEALSAFKAVESDVSALEARLDLLLPDKDEIVDFPAWLRTMAESRGTTLDFLFRGETPSSETSLGFAEFSFTARGSLTELRDFFEAIDNRGSQYLVHFLSLDVSRRGEDVYQAVTQGRVYYE